VHLSRAAVEEPARAQPRGPLSLETIVPLLSRRLHFPLSPAIVRYEGPDALCDIAAEPRQFPPAGAPEIAFLGRSNVGKSSLINSLVGSKIAKTSNTPGRTQTIIFFKCGVPASRNLTSSSPICLAMATRRVPKEITAQWAQFINPYLEKRESLALCLALVDVTIPPQELDLKLLEWLGHIGRNFLVVATRPIAFPAIQLRTSLQKLGEQLHVAADRMVAFQPNARGHDELWGAIKVAPASRIRAPIMSRRRDSGWPSAFIPMSIIPGQGSSSSRLLVLF